MFENFIGLFAESAPWLLLGFVCAALFKALMPMRWLEKQLGTENVQSTFKAALFGIPLPLCSCGVIPAALALRRQGASKGATSAFLVSTPETGVDSISISYALLGPFMAIIRPLAAFFSAVLAGICVGFAEQETPSQKNVKQQETPNSEPLSNRLRSAAEYVSYDMVRDIALWLLVGLFFAALVQTYVPHDFLVQWGTGIIGILLMTIISIPMYICATASTPIAAGLMMAGVSPGAALVFMLAGPATNIATIAMVHNELGKRSMILYLVAVLGGAISFGLLTDYLIQTFHFSVTSNASMMHQHGPSLVEWAASAVLIVLMLRVAMREFALRRTKKDCCSH